MKRVKSYRFFFIANASEKRLYVKTAAGDVTAIPFEAKIYKTNNLEEESSRILDSLCKAFIVDPDYAALSVWHGLDPANIPLRWEVIPRKELRLMKTEEWREILDIRGIKIAALT